MNGSLAGQVYVITGGGKGLGLALARAFAREGARLLLVGRTEQNLEQAVESLRATGAAATALAADVSAPRVAGEVMARCQADHGSINGLVNCAGVFVWRKVLELSPEDWERTIATNLSAVFYMSQAAARALVGQGNGGTIINIASVHGEVGDSNVVPQCAAKAGVLGLTQAMAEALREHGVRVNALSPGAIEPNSHDRFSRTLGQKVTQADLARVAVFLASEAASCITGATLDAFGVTRPIIASK